jgi:hypothetical protein
MLDLSVWAFAIGASGSEARESKVSDSDAIATFGEKVVGMVELV